MKVIKRSEAMAKGLVHYFTGMPCKYGHVSPRYVYTCNCVECIKEKRESMKKQIKSGREL